MPCCLEHNIIHILLQFVPHAPRLRGSASGPPSVLVFLFLMTSTLLPVSRSTRAENRAAADRVFRRGMAGEDEVGL